jgi:DNA-directed RNA polymerase subunit E'/Rpb7
VETVGQGTIQPGTGMAAFNVVYQAIVYRPFKGEVVEGVITSVNKVGFSSRFVFFWALVVVPFFADVVFS